MHRMTSLRLFTEPWVARGDSNSDDSDDNDGDGDGDVTVTVTNALIPLVSIAGTALRENGLVDGSELLALVSGDPTVSDHAPTTAAATCCCQWLIIIHVCAQMEEVCKKAGVKEVRAAGIVTACRDG